jgi:hypothetical protein
MLRKGGSRLSPRRLKWIEASERARGIVTSSHEMAGLYRRALRCYGEGELLTGIQSLAFEAIQDQDLRDEIFASGEGMLSLFCGVWIQFLLTEIAGLKGEDLRALALRAFRDLQDNQALH